MPAQYVVANGGSLVVELWTGAITHRELIDHERAQLHDTSIRPGAIAVVDCRRATFPETSTDLVHELSDLYDDPGNKTVLSRVALIMQGADFDKARVLEDLARPKGIDIITFSNFDVACTWLGVSPADVENLIEQMSSE